VYSRPIKAVSELNHNIKLILKSVVKKRCPSLFVFLLVKNSDLRDQKIESLGLFDVLKTEIVCAGDLAPLQPFFMRCNNSAGQSNAL